VEVFELCKYKSQQTSSRWKCDDGVMITLKAIVAETGGLQASLVDAIANRPDMQNAIARLMRPDDMLETFSELAVKEPDLMRVVLQAGIAAMVNVPSVEAIETELKRRAVKGN